MTEHIQIGDVSPRIQYAATGSQTGFTYPFPVFAETDLEVYVDGTLKTLTVDYTVAGAGNSSGGSVTFASAPVDGAIVTLRRKLVVQRTTDFQESGDFRAKTINDELDREVAFIQQVADDVGRTIRLSDADAPAGLALPAKALRAGKVLGFDDDGNVAVSNHGLTQIETDAALAATHAAVAGANAAQAAAASASAGTAAANAAQSAAQAQVYAQQALGGDAKDLFVSANDTTAGYLETKLLASGLASLSTQNDGGDETRTIDVPIASEAEAEAGTDNTKALTSLRGAQLVEARIAGGTSENDRLFALLIAEIKGDRLNMVNGIADPLSDETDVATKTNATYDASGEYYYNPPAATSQTYNSSGTFPVPVGNASISLKIWGAGGGGGSASAASYSGGGGGGGGYTEASVSVTPGETLTVTVGSGGAGGIGASGCPTPSGTAGSASSVAGGYGTKSAAGGAGGVGGGCGSGGAGGAGGAGDTATGAGGATAGGGTTGGTGGTAGGTGGGTGGAGGDSGNGSPGNAPGGGGGGAGYATGTQNGGAGGNGRVVIDYASPPPSMTLVSGAFTADTAPSVARLAIQAKPIDAIALDTDLIGKVSRDGGTTWTAANLVAMEALADGTTLYEDTDIPISGQPSGTAMKWKIETANGRQIQIHGVVLQWRN